MNFFQFFSLFSLTYKFLYFLGTNWLKKEKKSELQSMKFLSIIFTLQPNIELKILVFCQNGAFLENIVKKSKKKPTFGIPWPKHLVCVYYELHYNISHYAFALKVHKSSLYMYVWETTWTTYYSRQILERSIIMVIGSLCVQNWVRKRKGVENFST